MSKGVSRRDLELGLTLQPRGVSKSVLFGQSSVKLEEFLRECVSSYEELEALLLLAREPTRAWSAVEVSEALKVHEDIAQMALERLSAIDGLFLIDERAGTTRFQFSCQNTALCRVIAELDQAYGEQRLAIVQLMSKNALARMRGAAARRLADAFRFERPKK